MGIFPRVLPSVAAGIAAGNLGSSRVVDRVLVTGFLFLSSQWREMARMDKRTWGWLAAAGVFITANWGTYVVAINSNHVADAALGYFINPLVSVALGMVFLKERLRPWQAGAVGVAAIAVLYLTFFTGQAPYISLLLAFSFGFYGLLKKQVRVSSAVSVAAEALVMSPLVVGYILWLETSGQGTFASEGVGQALLWSAPGNHRAAASLLCGGRTDAALIDDRNAPIPHPHHADAVGALCHPRALFDAPLDRLRHHRRGGGDLRRRPGAHG